MNAPPLHPTRLALPFVLILYALLATLFILRTPTWQAPDEPAHWNYVTTIVEEGCCPRLQSGDWDHKLLAELTSQRFADATPQQIRALQYENHQPPLYYVLAAPIHRWSSGSVVSLRLWSAILGLGIVFNAYRCGRILAPKQPAVATLTALFVACLPQHVHILASINNDALAWLLISETLYLCLRLLQNTPVKTEAVVIAWLQLPIAAVWFFFSGGGAANVMVLAIFCCAVFPLTVLRRQPLPATYFALGNLIGLIFLTKTTAYLMLPVALFVLWRCIDDSGRRWRCIAWYLLPALLLGASWWLRNVNLYGWPDFLGLLQHNQVVVGQLRTATLIAENGWWNYLTDLIRVTYTSFWGQFGWMALPLQGWRLFYTFLLSGLVALGVVTRLNTRQTSQTMRTLLLLTLLTGAMFVGYNLMFVQWQGRYLYPALIPIALAWSYGLLRCQQQLGRFGNAASSLVGISLPLFTLNLAWQVLPGLLP